MSTEPGPGRRSINVNDYVVSDGWRAVKTEPITTSTKYLDEQLELLGNLYNLAMDSGQPKGEYLSKAEQSNMDALIHWLTRILKQAKKDDTVILEVVE